MDQRSITEVPYECPKCQWRGTLGECEADVDGDGAPGCPECRTVALPVER